MCQTINIYQNISGLGTLTIADACMSKSPTTPTSSAANPHPFMYCGEVAGAPLTKNPMDKGCRRHMIYYSVSFAHLHSSLFRRQTASITGRERESVCSCVHTLYSNTAITSLWFLCVFRLYCELCLCSYRYSALSLHAGLPYHPDDRAVRRHTILALHRYIYYTHPSVPEFSDGPEIPAKP
jgi:hypothetical protein